MKNIQDKPENKSKKSLQKKSKAKQKFGELVEPNKILDSSTPNRNEWIESVCSKFVAPTLSNRQYYRVILETLFPDNHGIPGPHITRAEIRDAIDNFRRAKHKGDKSYKNYVDAFRRVRELQGEEGFVGIIAVGHTYQLVSLEQSDKRVPRTNLPDKEWQIILQKYNFRCASCERTEPNIRLQQDHKIPRSRADKVAQLETGVDSLSNWQPLCDECNIFKSTSCRACSLDCFICPWAFPEKYSPLKISLELLAEFHTYASSIGSNSNLLAEQLFRQFLSRQKKK